MSPHSHYYFDARVPVLPSGRQHLRMEQVLRGGVLQHFAQCELLPREKPVSPDVRALRQFARA